MLVLALCAALAALAGSAYWRHRRAAARREDLFVFATARGWRFDVSDASLLDRWIGTPFGHGERRQATNVIRGTSGAGHALTAFDYQFVATDRAQPNGTGSQHYSVLVLGLPAYLPTVEVTPETLNHRLSDAVGAATDIDLESEDFNRKYRVSAYDPKFAGDVLTPRTMEELLRRRSLAFRMQGTDLVCWASGRLAPLDLLERASILDGVIDAIPSYVWRDHGASA